MNRPGAFDRIVLPSGSAMRGASGSFTVSVSGADQNPYPNVLQGRTDLRVRQDIQLAGNWLCPTVINGGPPYDDNCMFFPGTWGDDVVIVGTIGIAAGQSGTASSQELGFLVCGDCTAGQVRAYEIMIAVHPTNLYADIVRWNGSVIADQSGTTGFDILQHTTAGLTASQNGWKFKAMKVGNLLSSYLDTTGTGNSFSQLGSAIDITSAPANPYGPKVFTRGLVGVNAWQRGGINGDLTKIGWASMDVTAP